MMLSIGLKWLATELMKHDTKADINAANVDLLIAIILYQIYAVGYKQTR